MGNVLSWLFGSERRDSGEPAEVQKASSSALHSSIEQRRDTSYYYAVSTQFSRHWGAGLPLVAS